MNNIDDGSSVAFTGHSLGGALAQYGAYQLTLDLNKAENNPNSIQLDTQIYLNHFR
ncbi:lipase family protein [Endozoicomonas ascidiicola]|uniref:lipase family protein n=1 Tax=Endozoicomonas ascidiicola TaxID=1698521 RepID=UPI0012FB2B72